MRWLAGSGVAAQGQEGGFFVGNEALNGSMVESQQGDQGRIVTVAYGNPDYLRRRATSDA
jgi:hypothetical protein